MFRRFRFSSAVLMTVMSLVPLCFTHCGKSSPPAISSESTPTPSMASPTIVEATPTLEAQVSAWDQTVILQLGDETITYDRIRGYMDPRKAALMSQVSGKTDLQPYLVEQLDKKIEQVISQWLLLKEAQQNKLEATPQDIEAFLAQAKAFFKDEKQYAAYLDSFRQRGTNLEQLIANQILITKMESLLKKKFLEEATPEEKKKWYDANVEKCFSPPARTDVRRVCLLYGEKRTPEEASQELRGLLTEVQKKFETVQDVTDRIEIMKEMAINHSETEDARFSSGLHNVYHVPEAWAALGKEYCDGLLKVPLYELSDILPIPSGYAFVYVTRKVGGIVQSFDNPTVQGLLPQLILREKTQAWKEAKSAEHHVQFFQDRLAECVQKDLETAKEAQSMADLSGGESASAIPETATPLSGKGFAADER
ncbi:MAG TPA: SurA N-terminal domain-containing protein [bacterium]|nr:SurA N-terminal domain-containing protein [bacterium]HQP99265.1 SurA N-terminal domain-containing protein [bacterium]